MKNWKTKYRGSTLLEVLVSMSLASIVFVIGSAVWLQLNGMQAPFRQLDQRLVARELIDRVGEGTEELEIVMRRQGMKFVRNVAALNPERGLYEVTVVCYSADDKPIMKRGKIVRIDNR